MTKPTWQDPNFALEESKYQNPIPSRLLILQTLADFINQGQSTSLESLAIHFGIIDDEDRFFALTNRLKAMLRDGQLLRNDGIHYHIAPIPQDLVGKVISNPKGFGFLQLEDMPDLFLHEKQMRLVFHGDIVRAVATEYRGKAEGRIEEVIKQQTEFIGRLAQDEDGLFFAQLDGVNAHQPITLDTADVADFQVELGGPIKVRLLEPPTLENFATGQIIENLAEHNNRELVIETAISNYDLPHYFQESTLQQAADFFEPTELEYKDRVDLRPMPLVTIDGEDSRDFDDAVYAEKRAGGNYRLVVAIADVSHYVTPKSPLDVDAYERGTSVYFPHYVIPMLPERLSNGLCSLNPKVDRLCLVCDMKISKAGRVTGYEFYAAVMHSKARLTYNQVNAYFDDPKNQTLPSELVHHADVLKSIDTLYDLYRVLDKKRNERGALDFAVDEAYIKFDENGDIKQISKRTRGDSHKLIEECMLLANVCAANFALKHNLPVLYRNHAHPDDEKSLRLSEYLRAFGLAFPKESPTHQDYQRIIAAVEARPDVSSIHAMLLRSMMQAYYGADNLGHFGLAYSEYSHFTSPIRRYPDLMLHRAIKDHLANQKPAMPLYHDLQEAGLHSSSTERRAEEASRFVESWLKCHYIKNHIGEIFAGVVSGITSFGVFVTLTEQFIDGLILISRLGDEYFEYDAKQQKLIGNKGKIYKMGDALTVQVLGVNMDTLQIDFIPAKEPKKKKPKK